MIAALTKWKVAVYLTAIFAAGMVSGWMVARKQMRQVEMSEAVKKAVAPVTTNELSRWAKSLIYKLDLTPEQKQDADKIIERHAVPMNALHDAHMARIRAAASNRNAELMALLNSQQKEQFTQLIEQEKERRGRGDRDKRDRDKRDRDKRGDPAASGKTNDCPVTNNANSQSQAPEQSRQ